MFKAVAPFVALSFSMAQADYDWTAGTGDYSVGTNWTGTNTHNNFIDNGGTAQVTSVIGWNPNDLKIATKGGSLSNVTTGTVDISAGSLSTNYWTFVGDWAGNATLNVTGSGSYTSGALNGNGNIHVGLYGSVGVVNVNTTGTVTASGLYVAPNNNSTGAQGTNSGGTFNLAVGTVNISGDTQVGSDFWGQGNLSNGKLNITGGTMNVGNLFEVGHLGLNVSAGTSTATVSAGTLNVENDIKVGFAGNTGSSAELKVTGGTVNAGTTTNRWVIIGQYDPTNALVEVSNGGALNLNAGTDIMFATSNNSGTRSLTVDNGTINGTAAGGSYIDLNRNNVTGGTSTMTIKNGGLVKVDAIVGGANTTLNFDGGTLRATSSDANFIGGDISAVNINAGGAILDSNGFNPIAPANLVGTGDVEKVGTGSVTLSGTGSDVGAATVSAGTLYISGQLTSTGTTVASGAAIGGPGTLVSDLMIDAGGMVDITPGVLTVDSGATVAFGGFDFANIVGFDVDTAAPGIYTIIDGSFTLNSANIAHFGVANAYTRPDSKIAYFQEGSLDVIIIPEPGAMLLGSLGMLALLRRRRG